MMATGSRVATIKHLARGVIFGPPILLQQSALSCGSLSVYDLTVRVMATNKVCLGCTQVIASIQNCVKQQSNTDDRQTYGIVGL